MIAERSFHYFELLVWKRREQQSCVSAERVCKWAVHKHGGLRARPVEKSTVWADVLGASQQGSSSALGHPEIADNFIGTRFPLTGSLVCSEAFSKSRAHAMNMSCCNGKFFIHKRSLFFFASCLLNG